MKMIEAVHRRETVAFDISLDDVLLHTEAGPELVASIVSNARRYVELFSKAIDELMPPPSEVNSDDIQDVLHNHRMQQVQNAQAQDAGGDGGAAGEVDVRRYFPPALLRRYEVRFLPRHGSLAVPVRGVRATDLGKLVSVKCIIVRASDIKPLMQVATYTWYVA